MTIRNLEYLFRPRSIAVFGATDRPGSVGATVIRNVLAGGFTGPIYAVNPRHAEVAGRPSFHDVASLPTAPDLAVIATPPAAVPDLISELGARGTRAAIVLTAGLAQINGPDGRSLSTAMLEASRPRLLRILGPNCVGLLVPGLGINASFAHTAALPGRLAFVSQSGGLTTAALDWARSRNIGFSHFISVGEAADIDFGDLLDWLASDRDTDAILLYIESIRSARKFMSAARAAARNKPVLVVKAGRVPDGARAAASHTGALAGADDVFDAAIRRAGMLRIDTVLELFDAVETLARARSIRGDRLAIMTNGGGPGVMATDALMQRGGKLAVLSDATIARLDRALPSTWSHGNPVDIIGDAPVERYVETLAALTADPGIDAVLFMHAPSAIVPAAEIAAACAPHAMGNPVLSCWLGGALVEPARAAFEAAGIPTYATPEQAVAAMMQLVNYRRNQDALMQTPPSTAPGATVDADTARALIRGALAQQRDLLTEIEAKQVLSAYGIPIVKTVLAKNSVEAAKVAAEIGFPVALKIVSPQVTHKSDVGGVALGLVDADEVRRTAKAMARRVRKRVTGAEITGFSVQAMVRRPQAYETIVGATVDPVFGPVILFGHGGTAVEVIGDRAVALPPLNLALADDLVSRTRIARLLDGYRDRPPSDRHALSQALMQVSQLVSDMPEIVELDINPLLIDEKGVIALDARIRVAHAELSGIARLAIRPYPQELEERIHLGDREVVLRPIRPEDELQHAAFLAAVDAEDLRLRFFRVVRAFVHSQLARFTQIDYDREMAIVATARTVAGEEETLGVVRIVGDPDGTVADFAILVRSDLQGMGLGAVLMKKIIRYCRDRGMRELTGDVLSRNVRMLALAHDLGFRRDISDEPGVVRVRISLAADDAEVNEAGQASPASSDTEARLAQTVGK
jgi:acetyltransferase